MKLVILRLIQNGMGEERLSVERIAEALRGANCLLERGGYVRLLDVGGKIQYAETLDRKSGKLVPSLKFSSEDQVSLGLSPNTRNVWNKLLLCLCEAGRLQEIF